ncbi:MAG TPA: G/U mismatch-specific DNA glycosylase [bacterium]|nr:G/U mismatch-specific DNA glycosylase [bacterium]
MAIAKTSAKHRPTRAQLLSAYGKTVPDVIAHDLRVLFCGINPGLYSAATKHHFARPGNRFWPALHQSGFTPRLLRPDEEEQLLALGFGITNLVARGTAGADELSRKELVAGRRKLASKVKRFAPRFIAILGIGAYRAAFERPDATLGLQAELLGDSQVWVLPNPSGLNAHYSLPECARLFKHLRRAAMRANVRRQGVRAIRCAALRVRGT